MHSSHLCLTKGIYVWCTTSSRCQFIHIFLPHSHQYVSLYVSSYLSLNYLPLPPLSLCISFCHPYKDKCKLLPIIVKHHRLFVAGMAVMGVSKVFVFIALILVDLAHIARAQGDILARRYEILGDEAGNESGGRLLERMIINGENKQAIGKYNIKYMSHRQPLTFTHFSAKAIVRCIMRTRDACTVRLGRLFCA